MLSRAVADHMASYAALSSLGSVSTVAARVQSRADARPPPPSASTGGGEGAGGGLAAVDETTLMFSVLIVTGGVIVLVATAALGYRYVWLRLAPSRGSTRLAGGRVHTPSRVAPPVGRRQLPRGSSTHLLTFGGRELFSESLWTVKSKLASKRLDGPIRR